MMLPTRLPADWKADVATRSRERPKGVCGRTTAQVGFAMAEVWIAHATDADKKRAAPDPRFDELWSAWTAATDPKGPLATLKFSAKVTDGRLEHMLSTMSFIRVARKAVFHVTTREAKSYIPAFWSSLGGTEGEE